MRHCEKKQPPTYETEDQKRLAGQIIDLLSGKMAYIDALWLLDTVQHELTYLQSEDLVTSRKAGS